MDNGLWTEKFSDIPITGKVYGYFGENKSPKRVYLGNMKNGKMEGKWVDYHHSTGRKKYEYNFKDGTKMVLKGMITGQKKNYRIIKMERKMD